MNEPEPIANAFIQNKILEKKYKNMNLNHSKPSHFQMKFGKVNKDANLRSSMFSNSSHKQNIRDSMSMSKGGFIPKYEQQDEMNKSLRSQNTMHNEIS